MINIREHVPLAPLTTFQIGGAARYFVETHTEEDVREALAWAREKDVRWAVMGGGSNVLVADEGFDGLVIKIALEQMTYDETALTVGAGCVLLSAIREAAAHGLGGWEKMAGIPGTIGGAARGNAGAFGTEMKDVATQVRALHSETGEIRVFDIAACDFSYRHSFFKDHPEWIILFVTVQLVPKESAEIAATIATTIAEREKRHLQNVKAAGSYFMNPVAPEAVVRQFETEKGVVARENRVPAGWLIEKAGMKGQSVGGATASMQHPNYIVSEHDATAADIRALATRIKDEVRAQFGVELHEEAAFFAA